MTTAIARPTAPQDGLIRRLLVERQMPTMGADTEARLETYAGYVARGLSSDGASRLIKALLAQPRDCQPAQHDAPAKLEPGVYELDGEVFVVKPNRNGTRLYAKRLVEITGERRTEADTVVQIEFEYASGVIYKLQPEHKMPYERARELTIRYGRCIACGRQLKAKTSVDAGIGPVCRTKFR